MINVAVWGTGFGKYHVALYRKKNVNVKYVYGRNKETLAEIEKTYAVESTNDYEEILGNDDITLVDICMPTELHMEYAIKALDSGKHVFCETPIAFSSTEALEIKKAAERNGKNVYIDLFTKYSAPHKIGIEYAKNGKIGAIKHLYAYNKTSQVWGDLSLNKSIFTFFINNIDMVSDLLGAPRSINAFGVELPHKSIIEANYGYDGAMATLISDSSLPLNSPFLIGFDIIGDQGSIRFNGSFGENVEQKLVYSNGQGNSEIEIPETDDYEEVIDHVISCIENNEKSSNIDVLNAIEVLEIAEKTKEIINKY
jgi:predicted dehydrogenase